MKRTHFRHYCKIGFFHLSVALWLLGCTPYLNNEVETALEFAGENRSELQHVLQHYQPPPERKSCMLPDNQYAFLLQL